MLDCCLGGSGREQGSGPADAEGAGGDEGGIFAHGGEHCLDAFLEERVGDIAIDETQQRSVAGVDEVVRVAVVVATDKGTEVPGRG